MSKQAKFTTKSSTLIQNKNYFLGLSSGWFYIFLRGKCSTIYSQVEHIPRKKIWKSTWTSSKCFPCCWKHCRTDSRSNPRSLWIPKRSVFNCFNSLNNVTRNNFGSPSRRQVSISKVSRFGIVFVNCSALRLKSDMKPTKRYFTSG